MARVRSSPAMICVAFAARGVRGGSECMMHEYVERVRTRARGAELRGPRARGGGSSVRMW